MSQMWILGGAYRCWLTFVALINIANDEPKMSQMRVEIKFVASVNVAKIEPKVCKM